MGVQSTKQKIGRACGAIVVAAALLAPLVASSEPAACALLDAKLERARAQIAEAHSATENARARLVSARLRLTPYPTAPFDAALEDEAFKGSSAELRAALADKYQTELQLYAAGCDATERIDATQRTVVTSAQNR